MPQILHPHHASQYQVMRAGIFFEIAFLKHLFIILHFGLEFKM